MQYEHPLTPTLSPAAGARERSRAQRRDTMTGDYPQNDVNDFPLPIRWGEG